MYSTDYLTKTLRGLDAMQKRVQRDGWGRNSDSTEATMAWRYGQLVEAVRENDAWCDLLDSNPTLARTWSRVERTHVSL